MLRVIRRRPFSLLLLGFLASRCFSCIPQDQFECEDAAQRLQKCCGRNTVRRCVFEMSMDTTGGGCGGGPVVVTHTYVDPELQGPDARCLIGAGCDDVVASGACLAGYWLDAPACTRTEVAPNRYDQVCISPPQNGTCESARPAEACTALRRLKCR